LVISLPPWAAFLSRPRLCRFPLIILTLLVQLLFASGCVINNVIDQDIDHKMQRTQNRALLKKPSLHPLHLSMPCAWSNWF
jgi:protoheme IX farnesyltransferase